MHAALGLVGTDFDVLVRLARSPDCRLRMSDLAVQTDLSTSGITRIVDRLEHRGLIRRDSEPGDRRGCAAVLTDQGHRALAADLPPLLDTIQRCLVDPLTPTQLRGSPTVCESCATPYGPLLPLGHPDAAPSRAGTVSIADPQAVTNEGAARGVRWCPESRRRRFPLWHADKTGVLTCPLSRHVSPPGSTRDTTDHTDDEYVT